MKYSIEADNYWSYDYCEDCDSEESPACKDYDDFYVAASDYVDAIKNNIDIEINLLIDILSSTYAYYTEKDESNEEYKDMIANGSFGARLILRDNESGCAIAYCYRNYDFSSNSLSDFGELDIDTSLLSNKHKEYFQSLIASIDVS